MFSSIPVNHTLSAPQKVWNFLFCSPKASLGSKVWVKNSIQQSSFKHIGGWSLPKDLSSLLPIPINYLLTPLSFSLQRYLFNPHFGPHALSALSVMINLVFCLTELSQLTSSQLTILVSLDILGTRELDVLREGQTSFQDLPFNVPFSLNPSMWHVGIMGALSDYCPSSLE